MPRELFGEVTRPSISIGDRKWYTLPLSLFSHSAIVALLIAIPILAPAAMPSVFADNDAKWFITVLPPPLPPTIGREVTKPVTDPRLAPIEAPSTITPENPDLPEFVDKPVIGIVGGANIEDVLAAPPTASTRCAAASHPGRGDDSFPAETPRRGSGVSGDRPGRARPGHRDHRGDAEP